MIFNCFIDIDGFKSGLLDNESFKNLVESLRILKMYKLIKLPVLIFTLNLVTYVKPQISSCITHY